LAERARIVCESGSNIAQAAGGADGAAGGAGGGAAAAQERVAADGVPAAQTLHWRPLRDPLARRQGSRAGQRLLARGAEDQVGRLF